MIFMCTNNSEWCSKYAEIVNQSAINNYVHPYNTFDDIKTTYNQFKMVEVKIKKTYNEEMKDVNINDLADLFKDDDFLKSLLILYITLFEDTRMAEYNQLVESLGWKIFFFLREEKTRKVLINNHQIFDILHQHTY